MRLSEPIPPATADEILDATQVGRAAARRFARPGPGGRRGPDAGPIGSVAARSSRFAAGISRPVPIRRKLAALAHSSAARSSVATDGAGVHGSGAAGGDSSHGDTPLPTAPPRWWKPRLADDDDAGAVLSLPPRSLPRAIRSVPTDASPGPGRLPATMAGAPINVRRIKEVAEVGRLASADEQMRRPPSRPRTAESTSPPGPGQGDGPARRPDAGSVPPTAQPPQLVDTRTPSVRRVTASGARAHAAPPRSQLLRRAWAGASAPAAHTHTAVHAPAHLMPGAVLADPAAARRAAPAAQHPRGIPQSMPAAGPADTIERGHGAPATSPTRAADTGRAPSTALNDSAADSEVALIASSVIDRVPAQAGPQSSVSPPPLRRVVAALPGRGAARVGADYVPGTQPRYGKASWSGPVVSRSLAPSGGMPFAAGELPIAAEAPGVMRTPSGASLTTQSAPPLGGWRPPETSRAGSADNPEQPRVSLPDVGATPAAPSPVSHPLPAPVRRQTAPPSGRAAPGRVSDPTSGTIPPGAGLRGVPEAQSVSPPAAAMSRLSPSAETPARPEPAAPFAGSLRPLRRVIRAGTGRAPGADAPQLSQAPRSGAVGAAMTSSLRPPVGMGPRPAAAAQLPSGLHSGRDLSHVHRAPMVEHRPEGSHLPRDPAAAAPADESARLFRPGAMSALLRPAVIRRHRGRDTLNPPGGSGRSATLPASAQSLLPPVRRASAVAPVQRVRPLRDSESSAPPSALAPTHTRGAATQPVRSTASDRGGSTPDRRHSEAGAVPRGDTHGAARPPVAGHRDRRAEYGSSLTAGLPRAASPLRRRTQSTPGGRTPLLDQAPVAGRLGVIASPHRRDETAPPLQHGTAESAVWAERPAGPGSRGHSASAADPRQLAGPSAPYDTAVDQLGDQAPRRNTDIQPVTLGLIRRSPVAPPRAVPAASPTPASPTPAAPAPPSSAPKRSAQPITPPSLLDSMPPAAAFAQARADLAQTMSPGGEPLLRRLRPGASPLAPVAMEPVEPMGSPALPEDSGLISREDVISLSRGTDLEGAASLNSREWDELVTEVSRRIEARVLDELARRGRRNPQRVI